MVSLAGTTGEEELICCRTEIKGIVQGVGFRPFVYNLAQKHGLKGYVCNSGRGVTLKLEGPPPAVQKCLREIKERPPRLAQITGMVTVQTPLRGYPGFEIIRSSSGEANDTLVSPDVAVCEDCRREITDPGDRHYRYPFTNCTNCGPRFTIIREIPYDRRRTSMDHFLMCDRCLREYHDPRDRRFHAQPNACPECGPRVALVDREGRELPGDWSEKFRELILAGKIIAVKGLGGFHLVCDARSEEAVKELRLRKQRPWKPLAVMCRDLAAVEKYCRVSGEEARWLVSPEAPIVILERVENCSLPGLLAPNGNTLGVMLPYTPLHMLLFDRELEIMVMTSGNISHLPLVTDNKQALEQLGQIADFFLWHNREIRHGCDDSLLRVAGQSLFYRRSRGFVPRPVQVPAAGSGDTVLGMGGEMKNTFCLLRDTRAFMSQHLGEMTYLEGIEYFRTTLEKMEELFNIRPRIIAYDPHPGYRISALVGELSCEVTVPVQHHHAHMASCMAENGLEREVVGIVCDGTGYGADGCIWGCEILTGDYTHFERNYHLGYLPMPGGEEAVKKTWRMAVSYLYQYLGPGGLEPALGLFPGLADEIMFTARMIENNYNSPLTSSCGRLFDAVAALLGVCLENTYEGQAAVELGELVNPAYKGCYPFSIEGVEINPGPMLEEICRHLRAGAGPAEIATRFHNTLAAMLIEAAARAGEQRGLDKVVLSGGSFQNKYLLSVVIQGLGDRGFQVYRHRQVPPGDGGISLGQAVIGARHRVKNGRATKNMAGGSKHVSGGTGQNN